MKPALASQLEDSAWGSESEMAFFDVWMFNLFAPSNRRSSLTNTYRKHECSKKRAYSQRVVDVKHGTFTPLVFLSWVVLGERQTNLNKRLASWLSIKWNKPFNFILAWIRCCLSFSLLRTSISCLLQQWT